MVTWTVQQRRISDLHENEKNPRRLTKEQANQLERSIKKFGLCEPIVINTDNTIIGGHQRFRILKKLGYTDVAVCVPDHAIDQKESDELNIRLNKNIGDWDFDRLANAFEIDGLVDWGFTLGELHIDDLHDSDANETEKPGATKMIITFSNSNQLQDAENRISVIVDEFPGATYKTKY